MSPLRFDDALVTGAQGVLALAGAWAALLLLAALVESATRGRVQALARVGCPVAWRPALLTVLGAAVSVAGVLGGPVQAAPRGGEGPGLVPDGGLLPVPTRPVDAAPPDGPAAPEGPAGPSRPARPVVTVVAGDSLWAIARERLGDDAAAARVQALTDALHRTNRGVIGPDPDLLHPGQRLRVPPTPSPREDPLP